MIFIGDVHGKTDRLVKQLRDTPEGSHCFQLGDMGLGFRGVVLPELEKSRFRFIRGNHDSPDWCRAHPNYAGDYGCTNFLLQPSGEGNSSELFYLGGAWSIDWQYRIEGVSWWKDEELSLEELHKAKELYLKTKPVIIATHEAPTKAAVKMLEGIGVVGGHEQCPTDDAVRAKGDEYQYYKAKLGCVNTRTSQVLQQMFDGHKPKHWVFGHYHLDRTFDIEGCTFHCLNELSMKEINP